MPRCSPSPWMRTSQTPGPTVGFQSLGSSPRCTSSNSVAHLLANRLGETPRPFQAVTLPFNRLEPLSHWLQYTRTHIHCEHRASPYSDQLRGLVPIRSLLRRLSCTRYDGQTLSSVSPSAWEHQFDECVQWGGERNTHHAFLADDPDGFEHVGRRGLTRVGGDGQRARARRLCSKCRAASGVGQRAISWRSARSPGSRA